MGSVKDLVILESAYENKPGIGNFIFSDRYSIFDWGEMPNHIKFKGAALAVMAGFNFEELEKRGIASHYRGFGDTNVNLKRFSDLKECKNGTNVMQVNLAMVYKPIAREFLDDHGNKSIVYDYSFFDANRGKINNYLIGLEIIFRNGLPKGSSVFEKIAKAKENKNPKELEEILSSLGLKEEPKPGDMLPKPIMNYSTKLEPGDRNLSDVEAYRISGLTEEVFAQVESLALKVNDFITEQAEKVGMTHYDGKVEMIYNNGLQIADVVGTLDENRFGFNDEQISKEIIRQWYKKYQLDFAPACKKWKETGEDWQQRCDVQPIRMPHKLVSLVSKMYMSASNRYTGKRVFDVPELDEVMEKLKRYRE